jgi:hypothetical protein
MAPKIPWPKLPKLPTIFKTKHQLNNQVTILIPFSKFPCNHTLLTPHPQTKITDREEQIADLKDQIAQYKTIKANLLRRLNSVPNPNTDQLISGLRAQVSRLQDIILRNGRWDLRMEVEVNLCTCDVSSGAIIAAILADYERYDVQVEDLGQQLQEEMMVSFELEEQLEREKEKIVSEGLRDQILRSKEGGRRNSI